MNRTMMHGPTNIKNLYHVFEISAEIFSQVSSSADSVPQVP